MKIGWSMTGVLVTSVSRGCLQLAALQGRSAQPNRRHRLVQSELLTCGHSGFAAWTLATALAVVFASASAVAGNNITSYQAGGAPESGPHLHSLGEYVHGGVIDVSSLGLTLREDERQLKSGASAKGLLIVGLAKGGP